MKVATRGPLWLALVALAVGGCRSAPAPPPAPPSPLEIADQLFDAGDLEQAAAAYSGYLESAEDPPAGGDRSLFRLALIELARGEAGTHRGLRLLRRLQAEYPSSPYRTSAAVLLSYEAEVRRLQEQLDALKAIDLEPPS